LALDEEGTIVVIKAVRRSLYGRAALGVVCALVLTAGTVSHGGVQAATRAAATMPAENITIIWPMKQQVDVLNALAALYAQKHPDYKVKFQGVEYSAGQLMATTMLKSGNIPPLLNPFGGSTDVFEQAGVLAPWDPYLNMPDPYAGGKLWKDTLHTEWLGHARYQGQKLYRLPIYADQAGVFYNKTIFAKLHLPVPQTWDEWMTDNAKLRAAGYDALGWQGGEASPEVWFQGIMSDAVFRYLEGKLVKAHLATAPAGWKLNLNDTTNDAQLTWAPHWNYCAWKEGILSFHGDEMRFILERMHEMSQYFQKGFTGAKWQDLMVSFARQRVATFYGAGWLLPLLQKAAADLPSGQRFEVGYFTVPGWGDKAIQPKGYDFTLAPLRTSTGSGAGNEIFSLSAKASEQERRRAADFVMFIISGQSQSYMWNKIDVGMFPISKNVPKLPAAYQKPPTSGPALIQSIGYSMFDGGFDYFINNYNIWTKYVLNQATTQQTLDAYAANMEAAYKAGAAKTKPTCP